MESYIKGFIEKGEVRQVEDVALTTTLIVELLTWWTMDRKYIPYTENDVSDQMAKAVCLDNTCINKLSAISVPKSSPLLFQLIFFICIHSCLNLSLTLHGFQFTMGYLF